MIFPGEIDKTLTEYDLKKGPWRRLFGDQRAVRALRNLPNRDQHNPFKLYRCFNKNNRPAQYQASFQVYQATLSYFLEYLGLGATKQLTAENDLLVGLLHWDTLDKQILMIEERHELIKVAVESLAEQANGKQYLLVAPEYFYSRPFADSSEKHRKDVNHEHSLIYHLEEDIRQFYKNKRGYYPGSIRQVEETQYKEIVSFLEKLSNQHPNLILFPGTIAFRKTIQKEDYVILKKRINDNIRNISLYRDHAILINDGNVQYHFNKYPTDEGKMKFLRNFKYYAVNTALCFSKGQQIFSQDKVYNFGEIMEGYPKKFSEIKPWKETFYSETIFLPGEYQGSVGKINGLSFAIDICADHPPRFLKKGLAQKTDEQPMLHICESASIPSKLKSHCQAIGGYFIHASSAFKYNSVIKREREFFYKKEMPYLKQEISVLNKEHKGKSTMSFFKLTIPATSEKSVVHYPNRRMSI